MAITKRQIVTGASVLVELIGPALDLLENQD